MLSVFFSVRQFVTQSPLAMYARYLRTVAARAHRPARRLLSTAHEELGNTSTSAPPAGVSPVTDTNSHQPELVKTAEITPNNDGRSLHKNARAATVRVEYGIKSLPIGLAIVQEVERRFGKLRDFKMLPVRFNFALTDHCILSCFSPSKG